MGRMGYHPVCSNHVCFYDPVPDHQKNAGAQKNQTVYCFFKSLDKYFIAKNRWNTLEIFQVFNKVQPLIQKVQPLIQAGA